MLSFNYVVLDTIKASIGVGSTKAGLRQVWNKNTYFAHKTL